MINMSGYAQVLPPQKVPLPVNESSTRFPVPHIPNCTSITSAITINIHTARPHDVAEGHIRCCALWCSLKYEIIESKTTAKVWHSFIIFHICPLFLQGIPGRILAEKIFAPKSAQMQLNIKLKFYVPLDTKRSCLRYFSESISWLSTEGTKQNKQSKRQRK